MESLRGMVSFVQTARLGSFVRAAEALGISAVAVSRNVTRLEAQLGVRLFARTTRQLSLTAEGQALLDECALPLAQLDTAFRRSRDSSSTPSGCVRITSVSPFARHYLIPMLGLFHERYPLVELDIEHADQLADLVAGQFDVGFRAGPLRNASFIARPLGRLQLVLCAAPAYLDSAGIPASVAELQRHKGLLLKMPGAAAPFSWWLQGPEGMTELAPAGPLRCNDFLSLTEACCIGLGLAQLPLVVALPALRAGRLKVLLPHTMPANLQLYMHYPARQLPARVRVFVDFVLAFIDQHPDLETDPTPFCAVAAAPGAPQQLRRTTP